MDVPRFLVDGMLGRLARWLRILGYDTLYERAPARPDEAMAEQALGEGRVLVTRDRRIPPVRGLKMLVLESESGEGQLLDTLRALQLKPDRGLWFSRCSVCNGALEKVPREQALPEAPPRVREIETDFFRCRACRKLYWMGTHTAAVLRRLERLLEQRGEGGDI